MKKLITKVKTKVFRLAFALLSVAGLSIGSSSAQITNPAPYCFAPAANMSSGTCTGSPYGFCLQTFYLGSISNNQTGVCYGSTNQDVYRYWNNKVTNLDAGATYTVQMSSPQGPGYNVGCGFWIDLNRNNTWEASELLGSKLAVNNVSGGPQHTMTFTVPCNITPGRTRLRARAQYNNAVTGGDACSMPQNYGESWDFDVILNLPTSVTANFVAPTQGFVKTVIKFINSNQTGYVEHAWDANNDGTWEQKSGVPDWKTTPNTWTTAGTKCVKLRSTNCLGKDSIVKCLSIVAPTVTPTADFIASATLGEVYGTSIQLFDLSSDGPYIWTWKVYDSTTFKNDPFDPVSDVNSGWVVYTQGTTPNSQNPIIDFYRAGVYTVELIATNGIGPSAIRKKKLYITIIEPTNYYLGFGSYGPNSDNVVGSQSGTVIDDGGPNGKYGNDQGYGTRSYLQITPCNALKINLVMKQLKFNGASDVLTVYDGKNDKGTVLGKWSVGDKAIKKVTATSGSMFILFVSDNSGQDSGYLGTYTSELGPASPPVPSFTASTDPGYNGTPLYFTNTTSNISGVPTWEWTVDGAQVGTKKNMSTRFFTDGTYEVCLEVKSCVGAKKSCQFIDIITPNTQSNVDFIATNRRPTMGLTKTSLVPKVDNANRFSWTIFPTTYTLMNPPSLPSKSGTGFINYKDNPGDTFPTPVLKFSAAGCYTVTLRAWNDLDSTNTVRTVVKNKYICALDYCIPNAYILSSDVGINRVRVLDGSTELINNFSTSGVSAFTDYSQLTQGKLTFGRTYQVEVSRNTTIDPANRVGWIDWNIDGDFNDAGEKIFVETSGQNASYTASFTVPTLANSFEGLTKMRIAANYSNYSTTECGPIQAGEYEDYGLILANDNMAPVITLNGSDTVRIEKCFPYTDLGAVAMDGSEGNISNRMVVTSDLDSCTTGIYSIEFNVTDASGNKAIPKRRTIIVVLDKTPPTLTLNPGSSGCLEARRDNGPYVDPGATAVDPKNLTNLTSAIVVTGNVDTRKVGTYVLTYTVQDVAANVTVKTRTVCVADSKGPDIHLVGDTSIQIGSVWFDQTYVDDAYDLSPVLTKNWGVTNGAVNTLVRASYPVTYTAMDATGNPATPKSRVYRVDDFIPPVINLNTLSTVYHEVRTHYNSIMPEATDNYYPASQVSLVRIPGPNDPQENVVGVYTETFEAIDGSLNVTKKTRTVIVQDTKAPSITGEIIHACVGSIIKPMWNLIIKDNYNSPTQLMPFVEIISQNVDPTNEGIYSIIYRVTDLSGNVSDEFTRLVVYTYWPKCYDNSNPLEVKDITSAEESVNLYPNPSTGLVTLDLQGAVTRNATLSVYNVMGQVVMTQTYNEATGKFDINLSNQASGVYTIRLVSDGVTISKRVTLVH